MPPSVSKSPIESGTLGWTPSFFSIEKRTGLFYMHNTTNRPNGFASHPKDKAIMVRCLAWVHKCHERVLNPHSAEQTNTRSWLWCSYPLGHDMPQLTHRRETKNQQTFMSLTDMKKNVLLYKSMNQTKWWSPFFQGTYFVSQKNRKPPDPWSGSCFDLSWRDSK